MFFNELDILEIRLNTLNDIVDKFVLVEGTKSKTNNDKILYYEQNKERFKQFQDKIIHIVVDDFPPYTGDPWIYENYQRNAIARGLSNCVDDDIIMISDLDEIPNPEKVLEVKDLPGIKALDMNYFVYSLNNLVVGLNSHHATKILSYKDFKNYLDDVKYNSVCVPNCVNQGTTATKIRLYFGKKEKVFRNAGWHFSYIGNEENVALKLKNYAGRDFFNFDAKSEMETAKEMYHSDAYMGYKIIPITIDKDFPEYLYKNQEKFSHIINKNVSKYTLKQLAKKSKPKDYLRLPIKLFIQLIPNKKLKGDVRNFLCQKAQINYL